MSDVLPQSETTQTAVARRAAEAELRTLITRFAPANEALVGTLRRSLRKRLPTAYEVVYEYSDCVVISLSPDERGYEGALAVRASARGVELYFNRGKELPDPDKLLRGSGKLARFISVESPSTLRRAAVAALIDAAIAHGRVPYATMGRGPIVIRSTTAASRRRPKA